MPLDLDFGNCLWFLIPKDSQVYILCKELQNTVSDFQYSPHITIGYDISNNDQQYIDKWKNIIQRGISLKVDHPLSFNDNCYKGFYSLDLPVICIDNSGIKIIENETGWPSHLSFAYRFHTPFTMKEKVKVYKILHNNHFIDLTIKPVLAKEHCHCNRIEEWIGKPI